ncbi:hypothetical protein [Kineosporia sp. A_224]|uniref:hypothetical protein n=1 Tax=Kineosporia sp. A_224 TaxID=1962180 RepID=UPI00117A9BD2|nr:hypothetical protein [Kineosporia sp. A_224]
MEVAPNDAGGLCLLAVTRSRLGDLHHAALAAREATRHAPRAWWTWVQLAQVTADDPDAASEALHAAREAVRLAPSEPSAHHTLSTVLAVRRNPGPGVPEVAAQALGAALGLDPRTVDATSGPVSRDVRDDEIGPWLGRAAASADPARGTAPAQAARALETLWRRVDHAAERTAKWAYVATFLGAFVAVSAPRRVGVAAVCGISAVLGLAAVLAVFGRSPGARRTVLHRLRSSRTDQFFVSAVAVAVLLPPLAVLAEPPRVELWLVGVCALVVVLGRIGSLRIDRVRSSARQRSPGRRAGTGRR